MHDTDSIFERSRLRRTKPRSLILDALSKVGRPASHKDIHARISKGKERIDLVTVYRTLESFERLGIVHRHMSSGGFVLCSLPETRGHHGFLSCESCGSVEEFCDSELCKEENRIARSAGFEPKRHMSEVIGVCMRCR